MQVRVERYSLAAAALLSCHAPLVGHIHSRYARILNIRTPNGQLLTLQGPGLLQAPCAVSIAEEMESWAPGLTPGTQVALRLNLTGAAPWDGRLLPLTHLTAEMLCDTAEQLVRWLDQHASDRGIIPVLTALHGAAVRSPLHRRLCDALAPVLASRYISAGSVAGMAAQIIGLGEGLTPSGDDLLVGFLAVLHLTGHAAMLQQSPAWLDPLLANTTDLSAAFLRGALQGHFSEPMVRLLRALYNVEPSDWQSPAADLAHVGHSSGVDAMAGIALANRVLASN